MVGGFAGAGFTPRVYKPAATFSNTKQLSETRRGCGLFMDRVETPPFGHPLPAEESFVCAKDGAGSRCWRNGPISVTIILRSIWITSLESFACRD